MRTWLVLLSLCCLWGMEALCLEYGEVWSYPPLKKLECQ